MHLNGVTPVNGNGVASASASGLSSFSNAQFRFCQSTVRTLKKLKDAGPFLRPVDPIALNIPHYPSVIKNPMDFSTVERKLASSNPAKPDPNSQNPRYFHADEFIADVRLIFSNCVTFNGPDHAVTAMGKRVEEVFDKQIKQMPPAVEVCSDESDPHLHSDPFPAQANRPEEATYIAPTPTSDSAKESTTFAPCVDVCPRHPTVRQRDHWPAEAGDTSTSSQRSALR
jgi:hypothetical protein